MNHIAIPRVRLSFPSLFQTAIFAGDDTGKYEATFILDKIKHAKYIKTIQKEMQNLADEKFKGKLPPDEKLCLKDGDDSVREEDIGKFKIKASTKKRPEIRDNDSERTLLTEEDADKKNYFYAGSFCNCIISMWAQDNKYGKRINGTLLGIQWCCDGEPFGSLGLDADAFDAFGDAEEDDDVPF